MTVDNMLEQYSKARSGSKKLHEQAERVFSANGATHFGRVADPFRPYITHAKGSRKWDVDGNEYIDYVMGHGSLILGHSHPDVVRALQEQVAKGVHYGDNHELEIEWAELIKGMMPGMDRVEFCSCGQEANLLAVNLARIFTGRKRILRFDESFHGWAGEVCPPGTPGVINDQVTSIPMHDLSLVEKELATKEYAILMTEGGGAHMAGQVPWNENFIRALPAITRKHGTIWLIDEVVTGFREAPGGWQSVVGVTPDLTSIGKTIGGGLAVGAVGGRMDIMDILKPKASPQNFLIHTGTWNANPLTASAGVAACRHYQDGLVQDKVRQLGASLREKGNEVIKELKISARLYGRSIVHLYFGPIEFEPKDATWPPAKDMSLIAQEKATKLRLMMQLYSRNIATIGARLFIMSTAHTEEDINQTVKAFRDSLEAMIDEGSLKRD